MLNRICNWVDIWDRLDETNRAKSTKDCELNWVVAEVVMSDVDLNYRYEELEKQPLTYLDYYGLHYNGNIRPSLF